jgi:dienelactone hydrolase
LPIRKAAIAVLAALLLVPQAAAAVSPPAQTAYEPPSGRGHVVIMLSGHSGPPAYVSYAQRLAAVGYYVVLLDGKDILNKDRQGNARLLLAIARAKATPNALPGKVAVIGFSQGGGAALDHAATKPDLVSIVIAYYPETDFIASTFGDMRTFVDRFKVPVIVYAGVKDTYHTCCFIANARAMESYAQQLRKPFELVEYPNAHHGFNLDGSNFRDADASDAWNRTLVALDTYFNHATESQGGKEE